MKLMPASIARSMIAMESSWSRLPQAPNIMAPRHSGLTLTPVLPSTRVFMILTLCRGDERRVAAGRGPAGILAGISTQPQKPSLDGLEDKWTSAWAKERVVQV